MAIPDPARPAPAWPFWAVLLLPPLEVLGALRGGWSVLLVPACAFVLVGLLDRALPPDRSNPAPGAPDRLDGHILLLRIWPPIQALTLFWTLWYAARAPHLGFWEFYFLFYGMGALTGAIGIVYAHELMHRASRADRWRADLLLAMVLYSHFRSEHLLVHHVAVATPRDAVTARYNEGFPHFFWRVLRECPRSAWRAEARRLTRQGRSAFARANPFWRYAALQGTMLALALLLAGPIGLLLFLWQALVAIWMLELTNYIEHYGLTCKYLGGGRFEPPRAHHSWNAPQRASNRLLINLQRHSDHHGRPDRPYPLLQLPGRDIAPELPLGYPAMAFLAAIPPLWRRRMNPAVRAWRKRHYPEITDWQPYKTGRHPGLD
ncbi:alkane 1-monooxygenase [Pseudooceanicola sp. CBS1P-1]|uniref:Alkane 1-monooxygenase n=1 Tax=Pseudooceanicola albus TaxID=2692189 RepID=A0A6L7G8J1_9RHOB|nr:MULTISPECIES: alkane 1-monooxygenase [Pseudooceanicola]MBT9384062.1 alkane 1-monooxygenase [Pseudooceanicola endophyticus]MXN19838.1 alkane 1-monooxygenase [Pseudooceanicola albus]